jgi:hypothetical protein
MNTWDFYIAALTALGPPPTDVINFFKPNVRETYAKEFEKFGRACGFMTPAIDANHLLKDFHWVYYNGRLREYARTNQ